MEGFKFVYSLEHVTLALLARHWACWAISLIAQKID